jgi:hypothetical protein
MNVNLSALLCLNDIKILPSLALKKKSLLKALMPKTFQKSFSVNANTGVTKWRVCVDLGWWIAHCPCCTFNICVTLGGHYVAVSDVVGTRRDHLCR